MEEKTKFSQLYHQFFKLITDDMYIELTPEDTVRDIRITLELALPQFEFPRKDLYNFTIKDKIIPTEFVTDDDFILQQNEDSSIIEDSEFNFELDNEELRIIAHLMLDIWLQSQVTSIENTRMKYSGTDFKLTSQANHLSKLIALQKEVQTRAFHYQRLYGRRARNDEGIYKSTWKDFNTSAL